MSDNRPFPKALEHGNLKELFPGIHFVTGTVAMGGRLPMRFSRNMTVVRQNGSLTLVNTVRLNDEGLAALERLGTVENIVRLAGFHGMDDPFYKDRYGAKVWSVDAPYLTGFGTGPEPYFTPDVIVGSDSSLPIENARLFLFETAQTGEGVLLLEREGGIVVAGDSLQNWATTDRFFNLPAKLMMRLFGFIKPNNVGPGWLRYAKPDRAEVKRLLDLDFRHVLPAHGTPVLGDAKERYAPVIEAL